MQVHSKKKVFYRTPEVYRIEKTGFQIYEIFFKFRRTEKGFVEKTWKLQSILLSPDGFVWNLDCSALYLRVSYYNLEV
jgi:hypothetical protein